MQRKGSYKQRAIEYRRYGMSYSQILEKIPVTKSTLSYWFRSLSLSEESLLLYQQTRAIRARKGGEARRKQRITKTMQIMEEANNEIGSISDRDLWLIGIALYWSEGTKEKPEKAGCSLIFNNSDPKMVQLYILWLQRCLHVPQTSIVCTIYISSSASEKTREIQEFWSKKLNLRYNSPFRVYSKKAAQIKDSRYTHREYFGVLRVQVKKSIDLNRKVAGWISGITDHCGVV